MDSGLLGVVLWKVRGQRAALAAWVLVTRLPIGGHRVWGVRRLRMLTCATKGCKKRNKAA